jgi:hypothetical protein
MNESHPDADASADYRALYHRAFAAFGAAALWNKTHLNDPSPEHALVIAKALRVEGDKRARQLAGQIEDAVRNARRAAL